MQARKHSREQRMSGGRTTFLKSAPMYHPLYKCAALTIRSDATGHNPMKRSTSIRDNCPKKKRIAIYGGTQTTLRFT